MDPPGPGAGGTVDAVLNEKAVDVDGDVAEGAVKMAVDPDLAGVVLRANPEVELVVVIPALVVLAAPNTG